MKTKHDIWLTALQGHERAPLNDQELKQAIGLVNDAIEALKALNSTHYQFLIHDLASMRHKLYGYPNAGRAMIPNVPSVGDLFIVLETAPGDPKWQGSRVSFVGVVGVVGVVGGQGTSQLLQVRSEDLGERSFLVLKREHLRPIEISDNPSCLGCGLPMQKCVGSTECGN